MNTKSLIGREVVIIETGGKVHPGTISAACDEDFIEIMPCEVKIDNGHDCFKYCPSAEDCGLKYLYIHRKNIKRLLVPKNQSDKEFDEKMVETFCLSKT